jgi:predicted transposase YbfD/YdcC
MAVLGPLDIAGATVSGDAMFTQKEIAKYIVEEKNADYHFTVKDNQPTLRADIESLQMEAFPPGSRDD